MSRTDTAQGRGRASAIDGFRGLAALSTVAFHVWQQYFRYDAQGSHPPVDNPVLGALFSLEVIDLFFVLSAYLLTLSYARAALDGGSTRPARLFLFRRAIRILPLYFLAVLVVWATRNPTLPGNWRDLVEHLTFTHVFDQQRIFYTLGPTWSLSLEVLFYLVLVALGPPAVRACRPLRRRRTRVAVCAAGCLFLYAVPLVWIAVAHYRFGVPHTDWVVYFGPQARFGGFAAGMGLAVVTAALGDRARLGPRTALPLAALALTGLFALSLDSGPENFTFTFYHPIASALWVLLLFSTLHVRQQTFWQGLLTARWLTAAGLVSYSLFIWHEPVMLQLHNAGLLPTGQSGFLPALLIVFLVAVPVAAASYWLIEYPASLLGRLKDHRGRPREFYPEPATR
ncbi:acyltransferase [Streptomyces sp. P9-2B-2]|uniref:acyltransferase family protein n=1 Tax=Streptomyces TaxID=1883 RepID=UPI002001D928|nr:MULTISPECIES: acyltransferase [Streptomyces]MCX4634992.1 acyltransferase [Streptomyces platensis]WJY41424.1 acyltransferase [Streptomyces sp. P9-2B-2]